MSCALALPLLASLAVGASADVRLDATAESRTSTVAPEGFAPYTREALLARPRAAFDLAAVPLRLTATYAATIWTSDVEVSPSPLVTQDTQLRVETHHPSLWRAGAAASAAHGWTDPLADPVQALAQQGPAQSPALVPIEFQAFRAGADGTFPLDRRTTVGADASAWRSGAVKAADQARYPVQDGAAAQLSVAYLLSTRSNLRVAAIASATRTEVEAGTDDSAWATGTVRWRVRLAHTLEGWSGAGVLVSTRDAPGVAPERWARPVGEIGLAYARGRGGVELSAQTVPFTDRFTGQVAVMAQGAGALRWRESSRLSFAVIASGGAVIAGDTALAGLDARGTYALAERTSIEAGIVGRWQRERTLVAPSFSEIGFVVALRWESGARRPDAATVSAAP